MKKVRFSRFVFFLVLLLVLVAMSILLLVQNSTVLSSISSPFRSVISRVDAVVSTPFRFISSLSDNLSGLLDTYEENQELKSKISELESQESVITSLIEENENLSNEVSASSSISSQFSIIAKVIVRSPVSWNDSLSVSFDANESVESGMLVLASTGLVGVVSSTDSGTANISLLSSGTTFNIPVKITTSSGDVYGILESYDNSSNEFIISNLNTSLTIDEGATVVTSGLDGNTVANVSVGTVASVSESEDSLESVVKVTPTADFSDIPYVTIVGN